MRSALWAGLGTLVAVGCLSLLPVGGGQAASIVDDTRPPTANASLAAMSDAPPTTPLDLLFLHHSIGGHLLASPGPDDPARHTHPNGGGLRALLEASNYRVHEATYGSKLGEHTDMFDWLPKFRDHMPEVLAIDQQDQRLPSGRVNRVVLFKSCFPNNYFEGEGEAPGDPDGPRLTVANAKATLSALLPLFEKHEDTLFVYLTTPPNVGVVKPERAGKWGLKKALGKPDAKERLETHGRYARAFDDWAASSDGWLANYPGKNVAVFHLYGVLTDRGASNFSRYASGGGLDEHPNGEGLGKVAKELVPFVNRAVRRAGLLHEETARSEATAAP